MPQDDPLGSSSPQWNGVSKRSEEIDCLVRGGEKGYRLCSQPALVPLCSLSFAAVGWDNTPADK